MFADKNLVILPQLATVLAIKNTSEIKGFKDGEMHWSIWRKTAARCSQRPFEATRGEWATSRRSPDLTVRFKVVTVNTVNAANASWASSDIKEFDAWAPAELTCSICWTLHHYWGLKIATLR